MPKQDTREKPQDRLLRANDIVKHYIPVSKSQFYKWVKDGVMPPGHKLGGNTRTRVWWESEIMAVVPKSTIQEGRNHEK